MTTVPRETVFQIDLRSCSKEVREGVRLYRGFETKFHKKKTNGKFLTFVTKVLQKLWIV